jgi:hypothetical protein
MKLYVSHLFRIHPNQILCGPLREQRLETSETSESALNGPTQTLQLSLWPPRISRILDQRPGSALVDARPAGTLTWVELISVVRYLERCFKQGQADE